MIHTDFEKGFISANVINYQDFIKHGEKGVEKIDALFKKEGKDYVVKDADIMLFKCKIVR